MITLRQRVEGYRVHTAVKRWDILIILAVLDRASNRANNYSLSVNNNRALFGIVLHLSSDFFSSLTATSSIEIGFFFHSMFTFRRHLLASQRRLQTYFSRFCHSSPFTTCSRGSQCSSDTSLTVVSVVSPARDINGRGKNMTASFLAFKNCLRSPSSRLICYMVRPTPLLILGCELGYVGWYYPSYSYCALQFGNFQLLIETQDQIFLPYLLVGWLNQCCRCSPSAQDETVHPSSRQVSARHQCWWHR